jgi:hypothetical protein
MLPIPMLSRASGVANGFRTDCMALLMVVWFSGALSCRRKGSTAAS